MGTPQYPPPPLLWAKTGQGKVKNVFKIFGIVFESTNNMLTENISEKYTTEKQLK